MRIGALDFLFSEDGLPWVATRAWAIPRPGGKDNDLNAWELTLTPPSAADLSLPLHDLKRWMLFDDRPDRFMNQPRSAGRVHMLRRIPREDAMVRYLQAVRANLPAAQGPAKLTILIPAVGDDKVRKRYTDTLRKALPDARILPEPEMVVEYFRLVRRTLNLDENRNNVILVIDIGASTSNVTVVVSNRDNEVVSGETGRQRAARLRAIQGSCGEGAGQWVDEWLAKRAGIEIEELTTTVRQQVLQSFERAKIEVSRTGKPALVDQTGRPTPFILRPKDIREAAEHVVTLLEPILQEVAERLWRQMTGTSAARQNSDAVIKGREVDGPESALRLVDIVLIAGGTSQLGGFKELLQTKFLSHQPQILEVGSSFPVAAAVGALAHILHDKYSPSRIRAAVTDDPIAQAPVLEGALDIDIDFAWKHERSSSGQSENKITLLERGDPIVYQGGTRQQVCSLDAARGASLKARLIPSPVSKSERKGLGPKPIKLQESRPSLGFNVSGDRRMIMTGSDVTGIGSIWLDLKRFDTTYEPAPKAFQGEIPTDLLAFDESDEVVIDFGMSKTVVAKAHAGLLNPKELERRAVGYESVKEPVKPLTLPIKQSLHSATPAAVREQPAQAPVDTPAEPMLPASSPPSHTQPLPLQVTPDSAYLPMVEKIEAISPAELPAAVVDLAASLEEQDASPSQAQETSSPPSQQETGAPLPLAASTEEKDAPPSKQETDASPPLAASTEGKDALPPQQETSSPAIPNWAVSDGQPEARGDLLRSTEGFIDALRGFLAKAREARIDVPRGDLMFTLLGLAVRPVLLLAGPPGCGKSTLARIVAHLLGRKHGVTFHEVPVQAHWMDDDHLFGKTGYLLALKTNLRQTHIVMFDEINLTRPEYYLARFLHAMESSENEILAGIRIAQTFGIGTLNIDDTSRAPSAKILDRCFLVEVDQVLHTHELFPAGAAALHSMPTLPGLPDASQCHPAELDPRLNTLIERLESTVREHGLREDLLPSRRVLADLKLVTALHTELGVGAAELLPKDELIDRMITNRILAKLSGPLDQLEPALDYLKSLLTPEYKEMFPRTHRRISLAKQQAKLGFISPWQ